jgi:SPP1 gp7 family putative phage head morphogenesis protein
VNVRFDLAPAKALEFFRAKGLKASFAWQDMLHEEHSADFTVAKMLDLDLLTDVKAAVDKGIAEGMTTRTFIDRLKPALADAGWWGRQEVVDPDTGEVVEAQLGSPRRLKVIFETNLKTSYAAGHWAQIEEQAAEAPYLMYDAVDDGRTRPEHRGWDGKVLEITDPWWKTHYPPNGWNCRCGVIQLDKADLEAQGKAGPDEAPEVTTREWTNPRTGEVFDVPTGIDPGWGYHPGQGSRVQRARELLVEKAGIERDLGDAALEGAGMAPGGG